MIAGSLLITAYIKRDSLTKIACAPYTEREGSYVRYCAPNPFRDMEPEYISEQHLSAIRDRQFEASLPYLRVLSKEPEKYIGRERELTISSWRIINREVERDGRYRLSYLYSNEQVEYEIPIGFYLIRRGDKWVLDEILAAW